MDGDDRVLSIVLAAEHLLDLAGLHFLVECLDSGDELVVHRLAGRGPFEQHREVVGFLLERKNQVAVLLEPSAALLDLLCFGLVLPEIRERGARIEAGQFFVRPGLLKDSSADRQLVC
jgi:hypothetical protein